MKAELDAGPTAPRGDSAACPHEEEWFDRSICPEPCGSMHFYCVDCGQMIGDCALLVEIGHELGHNAP